MKPNVFFIAVNDSDSISSVAAKGVRLFRESGLAQRFEKDHVVAIKQHFGEKANGHFIKPAITAEFVGVLKSRGARPFLTDTATLYVGNRSDGQRHAEAVNAHGFTYEKVGAPFIPADGLKGIDAVSVAITGRHFKEVKIASAACEADSVLVLTHVTGHCEAGYGGAIKNVGMGFAPRSGKLLQHFQATPKQDHFKCIACGACVRWCPAGAIEIIDDAGREYARIDSKKCIGCGECLTMCKTGALTFDWSISGRQLAERMVEHAMGFHQIKGGKTVYVNFAMEITRDCDCQPTDKPVLKAVGILAGEDLVACEQATIDAINQQTGQDYFHSLWPGYDYTVQLEYAEALGLGSRQYELVTL